MSKAKLYSRFPITSVLIYNVSTILHFLIGGLIISYTRMFWGEIGIVPGILYFVFAFTDMYLIMPYSVCRDCVYFKLENGLCISGLNLISRKLFKEGKPSDFPKRAKGLFCPNNQYILSLILPIITGIPILALKYSNSLLLLELSLFVLLVIRFFFIIPQLACVHCLSKQVCPQAGQMGVREK